MDRSIPAIITALVLLGVLILMWRSWHKRSRRDSALAAGYSLPDDLVVLADASAYYVATTPRDAPLERLAISGLAFRARATMSVTELGIVLDLDGNPPVFIPTAAIDAMTTAQVAIDRVVETDGLVRLSWRLNNPESARKQAVPDEAKTTSADQRPEQRAVDSFFRIIEPRDRARLRDAIRSITVPGTILANQDESEA